MLQERPFEFLGAVFFGYAMQHARNLGALPELLAVWDGVASDAPGGTASLIAKWRAPERLHVIKTDIMLPEIDSETKSEPSTAPSEAQAAATSSERGRRVVKCMLFADIVGYSHLGERQLPSYMVDFLSVIAERLPKQPFINTWGDAIFTVADTATALADYAARLQDVVCNCDWVATGLACPMSIRIALHAGPVFEAVDPVTNRLNYYGEHVNRAARMEPVTVPGNIYASEPFVALLTAEQAEPHGDGLPEFPKFECLYLGGLTLAKHFGEQAAYHIRLNTRAGSGADNAG
jgi:class 3 adenylate cyclase